MNLAHVIGPSAWIAAAMASPGDRATSLTTAVWPRARPGRMVGVQERPIRAAASAICVRTGRPGEPEVLVVERSSDSRFLPGYVAFPGGAVDHDDHECAVRWFADGEEAHRAAAIRELVEEVGLA